MSTVVSVIVPCYNQAKHLDDCLRSIQNQSFEFWECLIIDDGSPDNTAEIAKKWVDEDSRFKYFHQQNGGTSSAKNLGIKNSIGDFIQILDCDDILEQDKISVQINNFREEIDILISGYRYFNDTEGIGIKRIYGRGNYLHEVCLTIDDYDLKQVFKNKNPFVISAPLYRKSVYTKAGLFDERLSIFEDWEFHLRCALMNLKFQHSGYTENSLTLIRLHDNSATSGEKFKNQHKIFLEICNENNLYIETFGRNKSKEKSYKTKLLLFIPPIITILYSKLKIYFKS